MARTSRYSRTIGAALAALLILPAAAQTRTQPASPHGKDRAPVKRNALPTDPLPAVDKTKPKPLIPRTIAASPALYLNRTVRVAGYPSIKQEPGTGKWIGTSDGMNVELSQKARDYFEKIKPTGQRPVFKAQLVQRGETYVLLYTEGETGKAE